MHFHQNNNLAYYTFAALDEFSELGHAITGRHGGVSSGPWASLNITKGNGDAVENVEENLRRICSVLDVRRADLVSPNQRHTANVCRVGSVHRGQVLQGFDILVTDEPGVPLLLRYADCVPVLIYDPKHHAIALVHSGWRGTVLGAARAAVTALTREYGSQPADMVGAIGPSIGACCYEVGDEVVAKVKAAFDRPEALLPGRRGARRHFDLWAANQFLLAEAGVRRVETARICTACHKDEFFSYRSSGGKTGHFGALMQLRQVE